MAQLALAAVPLLGQALGLGQFGMAVLGLATSVVGLMLSGSQTQTVENEGPRLGDRSPPSSNYGAVIPRIHGAGRIGTNLIWYDDIREEVVEKSETTGGGKGMGGGGTKTTTTTYYYYGTWASLLGLGPIQGVKRIWMNGQLVYDVSEFAKPDVIEVSRSFEQNFTVFLGTETQGRSSVIEAVEGDYTPAYRGMAYIVFHDVLLERFGNRIPQIEVEVVSEGNGTIPLYESKVPLSRIIGTIMDELGIDRDQYDLTQLSVPVRGFADQQQAPAATKIQSLAQGYLFDVVESDGILKFIKQPATVVRREHRETCLINEDGLIVNAFHTEVGRQGYFDPASGTSEGQFTAIKAAAKASLVATDPVEKQMWKDRAIFMAECLETFLYRRAIPVDPNTLWVPHWLFAVKNPIQLQSWMKVSLAFGAHPTDASRLRAYIPDGPGYYADRLKTVYQVYAFEKSYLIWDNPYAEVVGTAEAYLGWGTDTSGRVWVDIAKQNPSLSSLNYSRKAVVVFATNSGPMLSVSEGYEAWPHWRELEPGETCCATDTLYWALDTFEVMKTLTGDTKWDQAWAATKHSIEVTHNVNDARDWFRPMATSDAFSLAGTYENSERDGAMAAIWTRDSSTGIIKGNIPSTTDITDKDKKWYAPVQFGRGVNDMFRAEDTHLQVKVGANVATSKVFMFLDTGTSYDPANRYVCQLTLDGSGIQTFNLPRSSFRQQLAADNSYTEVAGSSVTTGGTFSNITVLAGATGQNLTIHRIENSPTDVYIQVRDEDGRAIGEANLVNGYFFFMGPVVKFTLLDGFSGTPTIRATNEAASIGAELLPANSTIRSVGFIIYDERKMTFMIERIRPYPEIQLPYAPYATPFTVNLLDGQLIDWRGSPGSGYTFPHGWAKMSNPTGVAVTAGFLRDAQNEWQSRFGYRGPFYPAYVWDRLDVGGIGTAGEWTYEWYDPNTQWGGYQYRPFESVAHAAYLTGNAVARAAALDFANWLNGLWVSGGPPATFPEGQIPVADYDEPHFAAYIMRACIWIDKQETNAVARALITKAYNFLNAKFIGTPNTRMYGSWANSVVGSPDPDNIEHWQWYGFWHVEIVETLAILLDEGSYLISALGFNESTIRTWLSASNIFLDRWTRRVSQMNAEDLGAYLEGGDVKPAYNQIRTQEVELPMEVQVQFYNPDLAYGQDVRYARRLATDSKEVAVYDMPVAMTGPEAEQLAQRLLYIQWLRRTAWTITLPVQYSMFDPGDVIIPRINGVDTPIFISKAAYGGNLIEIGGFAHDPEVYRETGFVSTREAPRTPELIKPGDTTMFLMNGPLMSSEQDPDVPWYYIGASGGKKWTQGAGMKSTDNTDFTADAFFTTYSTIGQVFGAPGDGPSHIFDDTAVITVSLYKGTLESVSDALLYQGKNAALIGNEVIQFGRAVQMADGTWRLTHLLRGRRGTEWATASHVPGEHFMMLDGAVVAYDDTLDNVNRQVFWKGVTAGQNPLDADSQPFTNDGRALKPFSPVHIEGFRDNDQNLTIRWVRRSRIPFKWGDGAIEIPLGEALEQYQIDILDDDGETVIKTVTTTTPTYVYPAADQIADFGTIKYFLKLKIYQISATVGRGYPGQPDKGGI